MPETRTVQLVAVPTTSGSGAEASGCRRPGRIGRHAARALPPAPRTGLGAGRPGVRNVPSCGRARAVRARGGGPGDRSVPLRLVEPVLGRPGARRRRHRRPEAPPRRQVEQRSGRPLGGALRGHLRRARVLERPAGGRPRAGARARRSHAAAVRASPRYRPSGGPRVRPARGAGPSRNALGRRGAAGRPGRRSRCRPACVDRTSHCACPSTSLPPWSGPTRSPRRATIVANTLRSPATLANPRVPNAADVAGLLDVVSGPTCARCARALRSSRRPRGSAGPGSLPGAPATRPPG